ncbi:hypothetical protein GSI_14714 [Ganoderma sinense ZZ0214-1]|uniref:DUF6533 domain-containing protein n=1 Tax=Ganoderma sinense ZZ0214-1 TaxID=1077348 RepID=A0A2G8RPH1_9APHY|nr:hypothetical protein GSI_14714 [Ganoderma sinense ZZ0214-1]
MAPQDSALIDAVSNISTAQTSTCALLAFVVYDWLINLDEEIRYFWTFRKGGIPLVAALLYVLSRYLIIVMAVLQVQSIAPLSEMAYVPSNFYAQGVINISILFTPAFFTAIRVYALSQNKTLALSTLVLIFGLGFAITIANLSNKPGVLPPPFNCSIIQGSLSPEVDNRCRVLAVEKC